MAFPYPLPREAGQMRVFGPNGGQAIPFIVPEGAVLLHIIAAAAGGAGGSGFSGAAATARGGGGGGGGGGLARLTVPCALLPKVVFVQAGQGGAGAGGDSFVGLSAAPAPQTMLVRANGGAVGGNGSATAAGTAGAGGAVISAAQTPFYGALGPTTYTAGGIGVAGGAHTGAVGITQTFAVNGTFLLGGAGGAGVTATAFAGGAITGSGLCPTIAGALAGADGNAGFELWTPPTFCSGSGGGSSDAGAGGRGGNGGPGCGGGGGGGGLTGGIGGRGGNGFVLIAWTF